MNRDKTFFKPQDFLPEVVIASPGRINLIGEHTDYNNGFVFPAAIDRQITFSLRKNDSSCDCRVYSADFDKWLYFDLDKIERSTEEWENFILGVVAEIQDLDTARQGVLKGFDCVIRSDLPVGAGLSSSAAMECGLAFGLNALFDLQLSRLDMAFLSQRAEHNFVGTQCGIMDQYASLMGQAGKALLLDCQSVTHEEVPVNLNPYQLVLINTRVSHNLASGEYNKRRKDCFDGVDLLNQKGGLRLKTLRDLTPGQLLQNRGILPKRIYRRCHFVIQENDRVLEARRALKKGDLIGFGRLLYASHEGLRHEYEVSCPELDFLVDFSRNRPEVLGSRMMGGGFGGCTLNLVLRDKRSEYLEEVSRAYAQRFGFDPEVISVDLASGTRLLS